MKTIIHELTFFINSILFGVLLIIFYDVFRIFRRVVAHKQLAIICEDILYWIINSVIIFRMMYRYNDGIIRVFTIVAILIGMLLYHGSLSNMVVEAVAGGINRVIDLVKKIIKGVINTILWPFRFIYKQIHRVFVFFSTKMSKFVRKRIVKLVLPVINPLKKFNKGVKIKLAEGGKNRRSKQEKKEELLNEKKEDE